MYTTWKVSKNGVFVGLSFPVFWLNMGKYGPKKTSVLDTFHAVVYRCKQNNETVLFG